MTDLIAPFVRAQMHELSTATANLIPLRYVQLHSRLCLLISILKVRDNALGPVLGELPLGGSGLEFGDSFADVAALLPAIGCGLHTPAEGDAAEKSKRSR